MKPIDIVKDIAAEEEKKPCPWIEQDYFSNLYYCQHPRCPPINGAEDPCTIEDFKTCVWHGIYLIAHPEKGE